MHERGSSCGAFSVSLRINGRRPKRLRHSREGGKTRPKAEVSRDGPSSVVRSKDAEAPPPTRAFGGRLFAGTTKLLSSQRTRSNLERVECLRREQLLGLQAALG